MWLADALAHGSAHAALAHVWLADALVHAALAYAALAHAALSHTALEHAAMAHAALVRAALAHAALGYAALAHASFRGSFLDGGARQNSNLDTARPPSGRNLTVSQRVARLETQPIVRTAARQVAAA